MLENKCSCDSFWRPYLPFLDSIPSENLKCPLIVGHRRKSDEKSHLKALI